MSKARRKRSSIASLNITVLKENGHSLKYLVCISLLVLMLVLWPHLAQALPNPIAASFPQAPVSQANLLPWLVLPLLLTFDSYRQLRSLLQRASIDRLQKDPAQPWFSPIYKFIGSRLGSYLEPRGRSQVQTTWEQGIDQVDLMGIVTWFGMTLSTFMLTNTWTGNAPLNLFSLLSAIACSVTLGFWLRWARRTQYRYGQTYRFALALNFFSTLVVFGAGFLFFQVIFLMADVAVISVSLFISPFLASLFLAHVLGSILSKRQAESRFCCIRCTNLMDRLGHNALERLLTQSQKKARASNQVRYEGWYCHHCGGSSPTNATVHLRTFKSKTALTKGTDTDSLLDEFDALGKSENLSPLTTTPSSKSIKHKIIQPESSNPFESLSQEISQEISQEVSSAPSQEVGSPAEDVILFQSQPSQPESVDVLDDLLVDLPTASAPATFDTLDDAIPQRGVSPNASPSSVVEKERSSQGNNADRLDDLLRSREVVCRGNVDRLEDLLKPREIVQRDDSDRLDRLLQSQDIV